MNPPLQNSIQKHSLSQQPSDTDSLTVDTIWLTLKLYFDNDYIIIAILRKYMLFL